MVNLSHKTFRNWNDAIAGLTSPGELSEVPHRIVRACATLFPADNGMVALLGPSAKPRRLYDDIPASLRGLHIDAYLAGAYLLDPYYRAGLEGVDAGLYRLHDVAPAGFTQSEYFRRYYRDTRIVDEVGFITYVGDGLFINTSFVAMEGTPRFRKNDIETLRLAQPVVDEALITYWRHVQSASVPGSLHSQLEFALSRFGASCLSPREGEVVRKYLQGHNTRSIADRASISPHTVAMHRKNAYSKLDIKSQAELFHLFIDSLSCYDPQTRDDPLRHYF